MEIEAGLRIPPPALERALSRRPTSFLAALLLLPILAATPAAAQVRTGDAAWEAGDFSAARAAYTRALADDPASVRSLYRLGLLASWDDRLDSALVLLRRARTVDPEDPDVRYAEALVLSWDGDFGGAIARYDSLIAAQPDRRDARIGRARTLAWKGDLDGAERAFEALVAMDPSDPEARNGRAQVLSWRGDWDAATLEYGAVLASDPGNSEALTGLGRLRLWRGSPSLALRAADAALAAEPANRDARLLRRDARNALRPYLDLTLGWSDDSDDNTAFWQVVGASVSLADGLRGFGRLGLLEATDETRDALRSLAEAGIILTRGPWGFTLGAGARTLEPDPVDGDGRTAFTARANAAWKVAAGASLGVGYARYPFDETAFLIGRDVDIDEVEASGDLTLAQGLVLGMGGSYAWLTDDNRRHALVGALSKDVSGGLWLGGYGRWLAYDAPGIGYFSPDRYLVAEGRIGWNRTPAPWGWRLMGGLGAQWIGSGADAQEEWRIEARLVRQLGDASTLEAWGGYTNAAISSTTGAYRFATAGVMGRIGL
ncbi:MAG TPA: tetratricopeptide repeat protein [Gemmatimonadales bacterium]|nr:tetratricopeptide repeat protein [Gemmatimonadales bacterium]